MDDNYYIESEYKPQTMNQTTGSFVTYRFVANTLCDIL